MKCNDVVVRGLYDLYHVVSFSKVIIIVIEFVERVLSVLSSRFFAEGSINSLLVDFSFDKHQDKCQCEQISRSF